MDNLNENPAPGGAHISEDRRMIALEATWEIEELNAMIRELCEDLLPLDDKGLPIRLRIRGLTSRINDLACVAMAVLDEDDETDNLSRRVHGAAEIRRVAGLNEADSRAAPSAETTEGPRNAH